MRRYYIVNVVKKLKKRANKIRIEDLSSTAINENLIVDLSRSLTKQIDKELFLKKYARSIDVLKLVGMGAFLLASIGSPNLPKVLKPFLNNEEEYEAWKRFNIPYLKRSLQRLEKQKFVEIAEEKNLQAIKITEAGKRRILKFAIDELAVKKPRSWDKRWTLVSYDIPNTNKALRRVFQEYLKAWGFYPLHKSVFLHAYPCEEHIIFLREYLGIGEFVRVFHISKIENDTLFRDFFGV